MHALTYRTTVFLHDSTRDLVVDGVPPAAVQIEARDKEAFDAVTMRSGPVGQQFIDAGVAAGIVTAKDLASGLVLVTVDRSTRHPPRASRTGMAKAGIMTELPLDKDAVALTRRSLSSTRRYGNGGGQTRTVASHHGPQRRWCRERGLFS
jgi:hypothetical protein